MTNEPKIALIPHTHWDREWYEPHDIFRLRLVHMVDELLNTLEAHPDYRFTLDGQSAAIDDYLEMRPESRARVERAVQSGQLAVGPFLILLDEFCCDGETIIRNLELGIKSARALGQEMQVGYLPDMFGHAAQTPQILSGFGINDATLWRGVPARVESHAFTWKALDDSAVRCEYLFDGYGNGLALFALREQLEELSAQYVDKTASWFNGNDVLAMVGSDHTSPYPDLIERISQAGDGPELYVATLEEYIRQTHDDSLPVVQGELRSHARGNLLPGVFSIRTNMKEAMAQAEIAVAIAERLDALYPAADHASFLEKAWYRIVESTAHDSVTGCGVDATAEQVETRLHTAAHIARGVTQTALAKAASGVSAEDYLIVNPSAFERDALVEITVGGAAAVPENCQVTASLPTVLGDETMRSGDLVKILRRIHGRELFGQQINGYEWGDAELCFQVGEVPVGTFDLAQFTRELEAHAAAGERDWHILTVADPRHQVLVQVPVSGVSAALASDAVFQHQPVTANPSSLDNGLLTVHLNADGTVNVDAPGYHVDGAFALIDQGDRGDSYNYGPLAADTVVTVPAAVRAEVLEEGPLRARIRVNRVLQLPVAVDPENRDLRVSETRDLEVATVYELRAGEKFLRVTVDFVNNVCDHRLRVTVPTVKAAAESFAAGQYGTTTRGLEGEGGWGEFPLPTYPATQFVSAGASTVLLKKLTEYEVVGDQMALTLVRSVGMMSVNIHPLRDEPAGSEIPVPGAQYLGVGVHTEFALLPSPGGWEAAQAPVHTDLYRFDPQVRRGLAPAGTVSELTETAVTVNNLGQVPLTALRRVGKQVEARFVNYLHHDSQIRVTTGQEWIATDLAGNPVPNAQPLQDCPLVGQSSVRTFRTI